LKVVALIPARGGSKRVPLKNMKKLNGKPLIWYAVEAAMKSIVHEIWVSTEDKKIKQFALKCGCKVLDRPAELASDTSLMKDVVMHFAENVEFDVVVLITPTYPMIQPRDVTQSLNAFWEEECDSLLTLSRKKMFRWAEIPVALREPHVASMDYDVDERPFMQEHHGLLVEDGGIYITTKENLVESGCFLNGDIGRYIITHPSIDIDTELDFKIPGAML